MKDIVKIIILICFLIMGKVSLGQCNFYNEITVSASSFNAGYTQEYVAVNNENNLISYIDGTGSFSSVTPGQYLVYAVNYDGARPSELSVGSSWSGVTTYAIGNCIDIIGPYNGGVINVCDDICTNQPFSATASSFYTGGTSTETYVLVDYPASGNNILASNTSGNFTNTDYSGDGVYAVYAVNTEDAGVISDLVSPTAWNTADATISANCADLIGPYLVGVGVGNCTLSAMDVKLSGKKQSSSNKLEWEINSGKIVKEYHLEFSTASSKFERLAVLKDKFYIHKNPSKKSFYRVKTTFEDNSIKYSNTIVIERESSFYISSIYPNPTKGDLNIRMESEGNQLEVEIHNTLGQIIKSENFNPMIGTNEFVIDIHSLEDAMYYVTITDGNSRHVEKITKRK